MADATFTGTHGTGTTAEASVTPFAGVTVTASDPNATLTLDIDLQGDPRPGRAGRGALSGAGLTGSGPYYLTGTAADITKQLDALTFTPEVGPPNSALATTLVLSLGSVIDNNTEVSDHTLPVTPTITGTASGQITKAEASVAPFAGVTITDPNVYIQNPNQLVSDSLTIALGGAGGTVSGDGLTKNGDGTYTLTGENSGALTEELHALRFTPDAGAPGISSTTNFTLTVQSAAGTSATNATTSVTDTHPPAVAFDATTAGFVNGRTAILTGTVASAADGTSVELYGGDPARGGRDLGAATVNEDGTWTARTRLGAGDFRNIVAVASDASGTTATAKAPYELVTGIAGAPFRAVEYDSTPDGSGYGYTEYGKRGTPLVAAYDNGDGTHTIEGGGFDGQVFYSVANDTITAYGRNETFVFSPGFGHDKVTDFLAGGASHDVLDLSNTGLTGLADVLRHTTASGGGAVIHVDAQDTIKLDGVTKGELRLNKGDFAFG